MTKAAILSVPTETGGLTYQAVAGDKRSEGATPGQALDALTRQLSGDQTGSGAGLLVVVQGLRPDRFFSADQQRRLTELMNDWRTARDQGQALPPDTQRELDALVEAELSASADRAAALADELRP
ncbi:MAG: hypothetical protein JO250_19275 [Armatimonadetes bacterium]|nr:hypothetical protein [Armatimonadota bacterium]